MIDVFIRIWITYLYFRDYNKTMLSKEYDYEEDR